MKLRALVAEFLGTFVLCFAGIGAICATAKSPDLLAVALAHGVAIAVMGSALGGVSGGHFNPAVTFGMAVTNRISIVTMIGYWIAQCLGGVVAALTIKSTYLDVVTDANNLGIPALATDVNMTQGFILEALGTFILVLVFFGTAIHNKAPKVGALFIGLTITAMILAFGPLTGTGINPARWFGPAMMINDWTHAIIFAGAPLVGGGLAAIVYRYFLAPDLDTE